MPKKPAKSPRKPRIAHASFSEPTLVFAITETAIDEFGGEDRISIVARFAREADAVSYLKCFWKRARKRNLALLPTDSWPSK